MKTKPCIKCGAPKIIYTKDMMMRDNAAMASVGSTSQIAYHIYDLMVKQDKALTILKNFKEGKGITEEVDSFFAELELEEINRKTKMNKMIKRLRG